MGNSKILCLHSSVFDKIWEKIQFSRHFAVLHILKMSFHHPGSPHPKLLSSPPFFGGALTELETTSPTVSLSLSVHLQMFSDYQMQQMSEHFIDSFGFGDNEFDDNDEGR